MKMCDWMFLGWLVLKLVVDLIGLIYIVGRLK